MSRKIRYRMWDGSSMVELDELELNCEYENSLMAFTGFYDIAGKEIWEGDVIRNTAKVDWVVDYLEEEGYYWIWCHHQKNGFRLNWKKASKYAVVGNKFENSDLYLPPED